MFGRALDGCARGWRQEPNGLWLPGHADNPHATAELDDGEPVRDADDATPTEVLQEHGSDGRSSRGHDDECLTPPLLPGPAAARKSRSSHEYDRNVSGRQFLSLVLLMMVAVPTSLIGYRRITYEPPPRYSNADRPAYEILIPADVSFMSFKVDGTFTRVQVRLSDWIPQQAVTISSTMGEEVELLEIAARASDGQTVGDWTTSPRDMADPTSIRLVSPSRVEPSEISLSIRNGRSSSSGQFEFLRTRRVDVLGMNGVADNAEGVVELDTGAYQVDRFVTEGVSRLEESEGSVTRYSVRSRSVLGANVDALPVPSVSVDLVSFDEARTRDFDFLMMGAVLGVLGGLFIELILTGAHVISRKRQ